MGPELFHVGTYTQTDMKKQAVAVRSCFARAPKNYTTLTRQAVCNIPTELWTLKVRSILMLPPIRPEG
jgi:hypothetical protein